MAIKIICGHSIFNENALCMSNKFEWKLETDFAPKPNDLYIVFGAHDPKTGVCGSCEDLTNANCFNHEINISGGVSENKCRQLLTKFFKSRR